MQPKIVYVCNRKRVKCRKTDVLPPVAALLFYLSLMKQFAPHYC